MDVGTEKNRIYQKGKKFGQSGMRMKVGSEEVNRSQLAGMDL